MSTASACPGGAHPTYSRPPRSPAFENPLAHAAFLKDFVSYAISRFSRSRSFPFASLAAYFDKTFFPRSAPLEPTDSDLTNQEFKMLKGGAIRINENIRRYADNLRACLDTQPKNAKRIYLLHDALPLYFLDRALGLPGEADCLCLHSSNLKFIAEIREALGRVKGKLARQLEAAFDTNKPTFGAQNNAVWDEFARLMSLELKHLAAGNREVSEMIAEHEKYVRELVSSGEPLVLIDTGRRGTIPAYLAGLLYPTNRARVFLGSDDDGFFAYGHASLCDDVEEFCSSARVVENSFGTKTIPRELTVPGNFTRALKGFEIMFKALRV